MLLLHTILLGSVAMLTTAIPLEPPPSLLNLSPSNLTSNTLDDPSAYRVPNTNIIIQMTEKGPYPLDETEAGLCVLKAQSDLTARIVGGNENSADDLIPADTMEWTWGGVKLSLEPVNHGDRIYLTYGNLIDATRGISAQLDKQGFQEWTIGVYVGALYLGKGEIGKGTGPVSPFRA